MKHKYYKNRQIDGDGVCIPIPESYRDCITLLQSDYYRGSGKIISFWKMLLMTLYKDKWAFQFYLRLASYQGGWLRPVFSGIRYVIGRHLGIIMSPKQPIGYGLVLGHGCLCMVFNPETVIGNNCLISQICNIGSNAPKSAVIGDNVYIGPMTCIVDDVHIGNNVTIGAGAVVTRDIPSNATAVGVPAKPINFDRPARYIGHKWDYHQYIEK